MTPEQRLDRAERMLTLFVIGRRSRSAWRKESRGQEDKINILINAQIATEDQLKRTDEQIQSLIASQAKTDESVNRLAASQAKTDEALRRFIDSLRKDRNGNSD